MRSRTSGEFAFVRLNAIKDPQVNGTASLEVFDQTATTAAGIETNSQGVTGAVNLTFGPTGEPQVRLQGSGTMTNAGPAEYRIQTGITIPLP